jgi:quinol monooxygenase YgiN
LFVPFFNLHSARQGQYLNNFQVVKTNPSPFFLMAWSLKYLELTLTFPKWQFSIPQEHEMFVSQLKIEIKPYKPDEFVSSMRSLLRSIRKEIGCLDFSVYQDSDKENMYLVVGEWKTRQAMKKHFVTQEFGLLIGAARVLGETFSMNIAEVSKTGGFELAKEQITPQQRKG